MCFLRSVFSVAASQSVTITHLNLTCSRTTFPKITALFFISDFFLYSIKLFSTTLLTNEGYGRIGYASTKLWCNTETEESAVHDFITIRNNMENKSFKLKSRKLYYMYNRFIISGYNVINHTLSFIFSFSCSHLIYVYCMRWMGWKRFPLSSLASSKIQ